MTSLSNNQKLFCQEYLKLGMNGTQAYLNVYKTCKKEETAMASASRLLRNVKVKEYIEELQSKVEEKAVVTIEDIVNELSVIAFGDRTEIAKVETEPVVDEETRKVKYHRTHLDITDTEKLSVNAKKIVSGYKLTTAGISVETCDKMKALELLGKYLGMFKDEAPTINNNIVNPYANLSEEELRKLVGD